jgi:hypothetical protein
MHLEGPGPLPGTYYRQEPLTTSCAGVIDDLVRPGAGLVEGHAMAVSVCVDWHP